MPSRANFEAGSGDNATETNVGVRLRGHFELQWNGVRVSREARGGLGLLITTIGTHVGDADFAGSR